MVVVVHGLIERNGVTDFGVLEHRPKISVLFEIKMQQRSLPTYNPSPLCSKRRMTLHPKAHLHDLSCHLTTPTYLISLHSIKIARRNLHKQKSNITIVFSTCIIYVYLIALFTSIIYVYYLRVSDCIIYEYYLRVSPCIGAVDAPGDRACTL